MPQAMGYPRDKCHAVSTAGSCSAGKIGDGNWDRNAYFYVNYNWGSADWPGYTSTATNPLPSNPTRYQVYNWEIQHRGETIGGKVILSTRTTSSSPYSEDYAAPICSPLQGYGSGLVPGDRKGVGWGKSVSV